MIMPGMLGVSGVRPLSSLLERYCSGSVYSGRVGVVVAAIGLLVLIEDDDDDASATSLLCFITTGVIRKEDVNILCVIR